MGIWGRGALTAPVLLILAVLAACNGGPSALPSPVAGVAGLCQPLAQAERFRYTFAYTLESPQPQGDVDETAVGDPPFALLPTTPDFLFSQQLDGVLEGPDKLDVAIKTEAADDGFRMIFIGGEQWVSLDDEWTQAQQAQPFPFPPVDMCNAITSGLDLTGLTPAADKIDGVKALRYEAKDVALNTAVMIWGAQSDPGRVVKKYTVTVWLSEEEEVLVRVESRATGTFPSGREISVELTLEVSDINASDIKIEPPI